MTDARSFERALHRVRAELSPSSADKARLRGRILASSHALVGDTAPHDPRSLARGLRALGRRGAGAGLVLLGVGLGVGWLLGYQHGAGQMNAPDRARGLVEAATLGQSSPARPVPPSNDGERAEPMAIDSPSAPVELPDAPAPKAAASAAPLARGLLREAPRASSSKRTSSAARSSPDALQSELALLRRVERALRAGDAALARALLEDLEQQFPVTQLREERRAARLIAECRLGSPDATGAARQFVREHHASVYRERVQAACDPNVQSSEFMKAESASDTHAR